MQASLGHSCSQTAVKRSSFREPVRTRTKTSVKSCTALSGASYNTPGVATRLSPGRVTTQRSSWNGLRFSPRGYRNRSVPTVRATAPTPENGPHSLQETGVGGGRKAGKHDGRTGCRVTIGEGQPTGLGSHSCAFIDPLNTISNCMTVL